jgi:hypothetical protein
MSDGVKEAADALGRAINTRDPDLVRSIYADDIVVWHGSTGKPMGKTENVDLLAGVFRITSELEYVNIQRHFFDGGLVQQHRLVGKFDDGRDLPGLEACLVIKVSNGLITRIDEYFSSDVFAEVWARLSALAPA